MPDNNCTSFVFENPGPRTDNNAGGHWLDGEARKYKARRPHTKSRKGCNTCKRRRAKCDERKPRCGQCIHGDRLCNYASSIATSNAPSKAGRQQAFGVPTQIPAGYVDGFHVAYPDVWNMAATTVNTTELLDHFMHTTHHLWIGGPTCQMTLQRHGSRLAARATYLQHAMLAFSAYHLATVRPETEEYELAGGIYYSHALQSYSEALRHLETTNADALFACAILLGMMAYKNLTSGPTRPSPALDMNAIPNIAALQAMAGVQVLKSLSTLQNKIGQSAIIGQCEEDQPIYLRSAAEYSENLALVEKLEKFCKSDARSTTSNGAYDTVLRYLRRLMLSELGDGSFATYCFFTRGIDSRFMAMLQKKDPKALLILCYWYAVGARIGQWWMVDSAKRDGTKLLSYLRQDPDIEIHELLEFPLKSFVSAQCDKAGM